MCSQIKNTIIMKRFFLLLIATFLFSFFTNAQKSEVKDGVIYHEGNAIAKIEKEGCGAFSSTCSFYIKSLSGELLITIVALEMKDPDEISIADSEGNVRYLRYSFSGINGVAETKNPSKLTTKPKDVIQSIVKGGLIKEGKLDETAVLNFINANGTRFTQRQKDLNNPQIIIIRE